MIWAKRANGRFHFKRITMVALLMIKGKGRHREISEEEIVIVHKRNDEGLKQDGISRDCKN